MTDYTVGMNYMMDTHQAVKELVAKGFAEEQAEAIVYLQVRFLNGNVERAEAVKELVTKGFAEEQAEAIVSLQVRCLSENVERAK